MLFYCFVAIEAECPDGEKEPRKGGGKGGLMGAPSKIETAFYNSFVLGGESTSVKTLA